MISGTRSLNPHAPDVEWKEYEFKCKPGNVTRRPCVISPYHYRLDWLMWFAAFQSVRHQPWLLDLSYKFLNNDPGVMNLIAHNPFEGEDPPKFIRMDHYKYWYTKRGSAAALRGDWWERRKVATYFRAVDKAALEQALPYLGTHSSTSSLSD